MRCLESRREVATHFEPPDEAWHGPLSPFQVAGALLTFAGPTEEKLQKALDQHQPSQ